MALREKTLKIVWGKFIQCFIYLQIKRSENKTHLRIFSYLLYFRGAVRLDVGVVTRRDFRSGWRRCWSAVIFVRVCKVESKHILGVFDWRVEISGRQCDKHHAILKISLWNAPDGVFDPEWACFAIHHGLGYRVELHWFAVALFKGAYWNEDWIIYKLVERHKTAPESDDDLQL